MIKRKREREKFTNKGKEKKNSKANGDNFWKMPKESEAEESERKRSF